MGSLLSGYPVARRGSCKRQFFFLEKRFRVVKYTKLSSLIYVPRRCSCGKGGGGGVVEGVQFQQISEFKKGG